MAKHLTLTCFILAAFSLLLLVESDCIVFRKPEVKTEWAGYLCCTWRVGMALRSTSTCFSRVTPVNDASMLAKNLDYTVPSLYIFSMGFIYEAYTGLFPGQPNSWAEICPLRPLEAVGEAGCHATRLFFPLKLASSDFFNKCENVMQAVLSRRAGYHLSRDCGRDAWIKLKNL